MPEIRVGLLLDMKILEKLNLETVVYSN